MWLDRLIPHRDARDMLGRRRSPTPRHRTGGAPRGLAAASIPL